MLNFGFKSKKKIVIIGGGISGLTLAYRILTLVNQRRLDPDITLVDRGLRFGGVIQTLHKDGFIMETGPDSFITDKPWAVDLARELDLDNQFCRTNEKARRSFIYSGGKLIPVSAGFYMMAPTSFAALWSTPLISLPGKIRMAMEPMIGRRQESGDESVASFIRRRFGREALEKIGQPMIGGIYSADPEKLSLEATFPKFLEMEKKYGSVMKALMQKGRNLNEKTASGPRYSLFMSFQDGMSELIDRLVNRMKAVQFLSDATAVRLEKNREWRVTLSDGHQIKADILCLAVSAPVAAELLEAISPAAASDLRKIPYESSATLNLVYDRRAVTHPLDGFGYVVPSIEKKSIVGCTFSSIKYPGRSLNENAVLLRAFIGGRCQQDILSLDDAALKKKVGDEIAETLGIRKPPLQSYLQRWPRSMPQYHVGHKELVRKIFDYIYYEHRSLYLTGNAYEGIGIPDCIRQANQTAARVVDHL